MKSIAYLLVDQTNDHFNKILPTGRDAGSEQNDEMHWLLEGINLSAMQPHPTRNYQRVG